MGIASEWVALVAARTRLPCLEEPLIGMGSPRSERLFLCYYIVKVSPFFKRKGGGAFTPGAASLLPFSLPGSRNRCRVFDLLEIYVSGHFRPLLLITNPVDQLEVVPIIRATPTSYRDYLVNLWCEGMKIRKSFVDFPPA